MPSISMKELLEAGVHFGHQTKRWNPKMKEYIFGERNGIYIVDLQKTLKLFKDAMAYVGDMASQGKNVLFVGTKRQAQEAIAEEATRCQMFYINNRWLGGLLTNYTTVKKSIERLKMLEELAETGNYGGRTKKEIIQLERERKHLSANLSGIRDMGRLPDVLFVVDSNKEAIAVAEARVLNIPVVAVLDSNSDPAGITYPIPGNDDAIRAIKLYCELVANTVLTGIKDEMKSSGVDIGSRDAAPAEALPEGEAEAGADGKIEVVVKKSRSKPRGKQPEGAAAGEEVSA